MKKFKFYILFFSMLLSGCRYSAEQSVKKDIIVDTTGVIQFTDGIMSENGYDISGRRVNQRTDNPSLFVIEYWYKEDGTEHHYGFYIRENEDSFEIIKEGEQVEGQMLE